METELDIKKMTKRAKPKRDAQGNWLRNGAAAKSGLNKAILGSVWGKVKTYTKYKSKRKGKFLIEVPANYSSQECAACGNVHSDNRKKSEFVCLCCGNRDHADRNAAKVIAKRGVALLLSESFTVKKKKRVGIKRNKVSAGCAELGVGLQEEPLPMLVEATVRRGEAKNFSSHMPLKRETPTTSKML